MPLPHTTLPDLWWSRPLRWLPPAFLVGLILAAGTADVVLPSVSDASCRLSEMDEPIRSSVDDYCRIRRDGLIDLRLALFECVPFPDGSSRLSPSSRPVLGPSTPPHHPHTTATEHRPSLARRSRAPGLRPGC